MCVGWESMEENVAQVLDRPVGASLIVYAAAKSDEDAWTVPHGYSRFQVIMVGDRSSRKEVDLPEERLGPRHSTACHSLWGPGPIGGPCKSLNQ